MAKRGRKPLPDAIKALRGNPGKRKLFLEGEYNPIPPALPPAKIPDFLTDARERNAFQSCVDDYLQRRVARISDLGAYGRWSYYLIKWIECKQQLEGKESFLPKELGFRRHPLFREMLDLERALQTLEDRLGLNPVARQSIIRGLSAMPSSLGGLFGDERPAELEKPATDETATRQLQEENPSPLGFLTTAGKPH